MVLAPEVKEIINTFNQDSNTARTGKYTITMELGGQLVEKKIFVKQSKKSESENGYGEMAQKECGFYQYLRENSIENVPVPKCYLAYTGRKAKEFLLILEDTGEEYTEPTSYSLDTEECWLFCAESLAKLHTACWGKGEQVPGCPDDNKIEEDIANAHNSMTHFLEQYHDKLTSQESGIFQMALEINDLLLRERYTTQKGRSRLTLCNGDSHIYNFMLPKKKGALPLIVDFQFWGAGYGTSDLAHLTRVCYPEKMKKESEYTLVQHYHQCLLSNGVKNYSLEECISDYRKDVAAMMLIPFWQASSFGLPYEEWRLDIPDLVSNFEHMSCTKVLEDN